jgi:hypothetical protein
MVPCIFIIRQDCLKGTAGELGVQPFVVEKYVLVEIFESSGSYQMERKLAELSEIVPRHFTVFAVEDQRLHWYFPIRHTFLISQIESRTRRLAHLQ